jgi:hypothetical protein
MTAASALNKGVVLTQCRVAAERKLAQALDPLLDAAVERLAELGQQEQDLRGREQYLTGAMRLRSQRDGYYAGFRKGFGERFDANARAMMRGGPGWEELDRETAAMLRTNVLENEVAIIKLGVRLKEASREDLAGFSARLVTLFRLHELDDGENPLGPAAIAHGVYAGFVAARVEGHAARALRPLIEERLLAPVRELYRGLNHALDGLGITPHVAPAAARAAAPDAVSAATARPSPAAPLPAAPPVAGAPEAAAPPAVSLAAETAAARRMVGLLRDRQVPEALLPFLRHASVRALALAYETGGEQGAAWRDAVRTVEDLLWSIAPKPDATSRARLRTMLPDMLKRIDAGMASVALPAEERRRILDALMAIHRALLQQDR